MRNLFRKIFLFLFPPARKLISSSVNWMIITSHKQGNFGKDINIAPTYRLMHVEIGERTYLSENSLVSYTVFGKYCSVGPNLLCGWGIHPTNGISTSPVFYSSQNQLKVSFCRKTKIKERKQIVIGNDVFIGANVTILDGVTIGDGAVIGAGAIVSKDIPPYAIAYGSPIKIARYRFSEDQIESLLRIKWWDFDEERLRDVESMFFDIDEFIKKYDVNEAVNYNRK